MLEKRNFFSLFCLDLEAQLVHVNLTQLTEIFQYLVSTQTKGHSEVGNDTKVLSACMGNYQCFKGIDS